MVDKYNTFFDKLFSSEYRYYFDVDNQYVMKKCAMAVAPFLYRGEWI